MDSKRTKTRSPSLLIWKNPSLEARSLHKDERCKHKQQHAPMDKELSPGQNNSHPNRRIHFNKREPQESYTARHLYLPDTHAALYADNWCSYGAISRPTQCCYELRWECPFGGESLSTRRFERRGELYVIFLNAMPFYYLGRGERNPHSLPQPRGDTYTRCCN